MGWTVGRAAGLGLAASVASCVTPPTPPSQEAYQNLGAIARIVEEDCPAQLEDALESGLAAINARREPAGLPPLALPRRDFHSFFVALNRAHASDSDDVATPEAGIAALIEAVGPGTSYIKQLPTRQSGASLWLQFRSDDGHVIVTRVERGGPGARAGIMPGDRLVSVNGTSLDGLTLEQAADALRGPPNSEVVLAVMRQSTPLVVEAKREHLNERICECGIRWRVVNEVAVVTIPHLSEGAARTVERAIRAAKRAHPSLRGYVLDFRNNPGGRLDEVVKLAELFLEGGQLGSLVPAGACTFADSETLTTVQRDSEVGDAPVVILMNDATASGPELFIAAMAGRATTVGAQTYGAGHVDTLIPFGDHAGVRIRSGEMVTPSGSRFTGVGLTPDIEVEETDPARDAALERALEMLGG